VRVDGPADRVAAELATLPGVVRVERGAPDGLPGVPFALSARDPEPAQRALGAAVVARGWTLLEVRASAPSLEDLFVQLVGPAGDGAGEPRG